MKKFACTLVTAAALAAAIPAYAATAETPMAGTTKPTGTSMSPAPGTETNVNHGSGAATDNVSKQTPAEAQAATSADANAAVEKKQKKEGFFSRLFHRDEKADTSATPAPSDSRR